MKNVSGLSLLLILASNGPTCAWAEDSIWRDIAHGGANVLYCYLRAEGRAVPYATLETELMETTSATFTSVAEVAARHGRALEAHSLSFEALVRCPRPIIAHLDGETPEEGAFVLILAFAKDAVYYVNGPTASIHALDPEDFRRAWSGVALLPAQHQTLRSAAVIAGFLGALVLVIARKVAFSRWGKQSLQSPSNLLL